MSKRMLKNMSEEVSVLSRLQSPNIIKVYEVVKTMRHYYIIVEYCNGSDLESLINAGLEISEKKIARIFGQVLEGMREMKEKNIVHRDIKNANIFISIPERRIQE